MLAQALPVCCEVLGLGAAQEEVPLVLMHSEDPAGLSCYAGRFSLERGGLKVLFLGERWPQGSSPWPLPRLCLLVMSVVLGYSSK